MIVYKASLPVDKFRQMSDDDKAILIILSNAFNEIIALQKLAIWSLNIEHLDNDDFNEIEKIGRVCQSEILLRLLVGKLQEIIKFFSRKEMKPYLESLNEKEKLAKNEIIKKFYPKSTHFNIRNKLAFHNDIRYVRQSVNEIEDSDLFFIYSETPEPANALFLFGEAGVSKRISKEEHDILQSGLSKVHNETISIAKNTITIIGSLLKIIFEKKLGGLSHSRQEIKACALPEWKNIEIPFFAEI